MFKNFFLKNLFKNKFFFFFFFFFFFSSILMFILSIFFLIFDYSLIVEWTLMKLGSFYIEIIFLFDFKSLIFSFVVMLISSLVILYSKSYMKSEINFFMFIILICLFVSSMILLIFSPNLISLILGWDGLGLISYLLVIYYQGKKSYKSGLLVVISNRIGDSMILVCIGWMCSFGCWNCFMYFDYMYMFNDYIFMVFLIIAGMTKSAQMPFSAWLPAAMAAPTPVSSLVHSSTLVTAGVYLIIRYYYFLNLSLLSNFLLIMSSLTMFLSGLTANFKYDLKNIIALSTMSQMALMMSSLSLGLVDMCFFHLLTHAMFKALLFMSSGYFIHNMNGNQDIRYIGSMVNQFPLSCLCFNMSNLSLCGFPFLSGFYSKDLILEKLFIMDLNLIIIFIFFLSTGFTISYSFRLFFYLTMNLSGLLKYLSLDDQDIYMMYPMVLMMIMSLISGSSLMWIMFPFSYIFMSFYYKIITLMLIFLGIMMSFIIWLFKTYYYIPLKLYLFFGSMWYLDELIIILNLLIFKLGFIYMKDIDRGLFEKYGGGGLKGCLMNLYYKIIIFNQFNGNLLSYLFMFIFFFSYSLVFVLLILNNLV